MSADDLVDLLMKIMGSRDAKKEFFGADELICLSIEGLSPEGRQTSRYLLIKVLSLQMPTSRYIY